MRVAPVILEGLRNSKISDDPYYKGIAAAKSLVDGSKREVHLVTMLYNLRLSVTEDPQGDCYGDQYCYHDAEAAWAAFEAWDGESEPTGWFKNLQTGVSRSPL